MLAISKLRWFAGVSVQSTLPVPDGEPDGLLSPSESGYTVKVQQLAVVASRASGRRDFGSIILGGSTRTNGDVLRGEGWIRIGMLGFEEGEDGLLEDLDVEFVWDIDDDVLLPLGRVDDIANGKRSFGFEIQGVLRENDVSPGAVEVSGRHGEGGSRLSLDGSLYVFPGRVGSKGRLTRCRKGRKVARSVEQRSICCG